MVCRLSLRPSFCWTVSVQVGTSGKPCCGGGCFYFLVVLVQHVFCFLCKRFVGCGCNDFLLKLVPIFHDATGRFPKFGKQVPFVAVWVVNSAVNIVPVVPVLQNCWDG